MVVAALILCPEGMASVRAAWDNRLQRAVNLIFGAALSTIALTVPAVLAISMATGKPLELGLSPVNQIMLAVTLIVCILTCTTGRTNVLNGLIHLVLFVAFFILLFEPSFFMKDTQFKLWRWTPVTVSAVLMIVIVFISARTVSELRSATNQREHTFQVLLDAQALEDGLVDAQDRESGYLQTGQPRLLVEYKTETNAEIEELSRSR